MVNRFYTTYTGHAQGYREYQPELAVQCLLYAVDAVILHLGGALTVAPGTYLVPWYRFPWTIDNITLRERDWKRGVCMTHSALSCDVIKDAEETPT